MAEPTATPAPRPKVPRNTCPDCQAVAGGKAHCTSPTCHWTRCDCKTLYDRLEPNKYHYREPAEPAQDEK